MKPQHTEANAPTAPSVGSGALLGESWAVFEKNGVRKITHVCLLGKEFVSTTHGTFNLKSREYVLDSNTRLLYIGTRKQAEALLPNVKDEPRPL